MALYPRHIQLSCAIFLFRISQWSLTFHIGVSLLTSDGLGIVFTLLEM